MRVPMNVDEARRDDQSAGVDGLASGQRRGADLGDAIAANADVTDGIEPGFRVDDAAAGNHEIVGLLCAVTASVARQRTG